uniref:hypothetical protein n=1 Tax=Olsenella uli TaxID=133926 RepID=UPI0028E54831|nr:hypothetical protein [Olsenella uli]
MEDGVALSSRVHQWATVAISDLESRPECIHRASLDPEDTWNGWACPYFEKPEAERMSAWLPELDDGLVYDVATDTFTTTYDPEATESFTGTDIDGMHLYPIGNGSWTWVIVDSDMPAPESPDNSQ